MSLGIIAETVATFLVAALTTGAPAGVLQRSLLAFAGCWCVSLTRREYLFRAEQAERTLAETRRAREAEMQAAALAERARIARDIHDVLAHSLAAVSVNLQAAEGLLSASTLPADNPELTKAIECIDRAGTLTREGLASARRGRPGPARRRGSAAGSAVRRWPPSTVRSATWRWTSPSPASRGRCPSEPAWSRTGPPRRG